jgi:hypothetical protein
MEAIRAKQQVKDEKDARRQIALEAAAKKRKAEKETKEEADKTSSHVQVSRILRRVSIVDIAARGTAMFPD